MVLDTPVLTRFGSNRGPTRLTLGYFLGMVLITALFAYDLWVGGVYLVPAWEWDVTRSDWLFIVSTWLLVYLTGLALHDGATRERLWKRLRARPGALLGLAALAGLFLLGTVGAGLVTRPSLDYLHAYQPPAFATTSTDVVDQCVGAVKNGKCHGTLAHPLGTDGNGFDLLKSVIAGAHVAVYVAVVTTAIVIPLGSLVGAIAGFYGGAVDSVLMRYVDVQQTIPAVVVYILLILVLEKSLFMLLLVFGLLSWGGVARVVRSEVLQRRTEEYVVAARGLGGSSGYQLRRHILPNVSHAVVTSLSQQIPVLLVTEAALAYLSLSDMDLISWGSVVNAGLLMPFDAWWVSVSGVVALSLTVIAFKVVGDAMRDVLDPRIG